MSMLVLLASFANSITITLTITVKIAKSLSSHVNQQRLSFIKILLINK